MKVINYSLLKENRLNINKESFNAFINGLLKAASLVDGELYERIVNSNIRFLYESPDRLVCELNIKDSDVFMFLIFDTTTEESDLYLYPKNRGKFPYPYFPVVTILKNTDQDYVDEQCVKSCPLNYWRIINLLISRLYYPK